MINTSVPQMTSAEHLDAYPAGQRVSTTNGPAWQDVRLSVFSLASTSEVFSMPAVAEPLIVWVTSGEAETQEREEDGPWMISRIKQGSLFVTAAGAPYDFLWKRLSTEPFEVVMVLLSLALFEEALHDLYGANATHATLRDISGFEDSQLVTLLQCLREEADRPEASKLFTHGIAQALCIHLARHYVELDTGSIRGASSLPAFKLRRITAWMAEHLAEEFSLALLAEQAGMSEYHFNRLFKRAVGIAPSQYQIKLRIDTARRLLRETEMTVITIANEVGYSNPSHFSRIFRKDTGFSPSDYRRQR
ncbi:helix-turn-helix domain-containing protein [Pseudomonas sp. GM55]|uniref:helix-turn-helix domain-containing protein n=1 Tax=Pseudomonas sp. GM55 TaxID=1144333 RepID=UPI000270677A|nr:AraC family transcriptional regulator [Pseudomonas sp. GM55]EJM72751.1 transcriptional regulator containing an amidase domain and an AraC-type DNA-binding HTH domain [Pseudomonas sp. GM55]